MKVSSNGLYSRSFGGLCSPICIYILSYSVINYNVKYFTLSWDIKKKQSSLHLLWTFSVIWANNVVCRFLLAKWKINIDHVFASA